MGLSRAALHPAGASVARAALAGRSGLAVGLFCAGGTIRLALGPLIALAVVAWADLLAPRLGRSLLVGGTTLLAPLPLFAMLQVEPGSWTYFASAALAGGLVNAGLPLRIVSAQELAPKAVAAASGMVMGFAMGIAGLLYVGVGILQEAIGLAPAMSVAYATLVPAALLAFVVLGRPDLAATPAGPVPAALSLAGLPCPCSRWYAASERASAVGTARPLGGPGHAGAAAWVEGPAACTCSVGVGGRAQDCRGQRATMAVA